MEKRLGIAITLILMFIVSSGLASAALGMSPAKKEFNFEPNERYSIIYTTYSDNAEKKISLYADGDLAQYVTFSKSELIGGGSFKVTINLPESIEVPGKHQLYIASKEEPPEDVFIGTAIIIRALVNIYVPYPGKFVEAEMNLPSGNVGDLIPIELKVTDRGKEDFNLIMHINILDSAMNNVAVIALNPTRITSGETKTFGKYLNTSGFKAGKYLAEAVINYEDGDIYKVNKTFGIGSLFVNITNFTNRLETGDLRKFLVYAEGMWNDNIKEIYADVNISNGTYSTTFRTPSVDLGAWQTVKLEGYLDTAGLLGLYNSKITLNYLGQNSSAYGYLEVYLPKAFNWSILAMYAGAALTVVIALALYFMLRDKKKRK